MNYKAILFGIIVLFGSLIGCQQTEKITTKIDTVKLITTKYDTVVLNSKDTVVIVNKDTIYISNNPSATTDGYIKGVYTFADGTTDSVTLTVPLYEHDYWTYDSTTQTYLITIGRGDTYLVSNQSSGVSFNFMQLSIEMNSNIFIINTAKVGLNLVVNNKVNIESYHYDQVATITSYNFNPTTSDLFFVFEFQLQGQPTVNGVYKGKCYQLTNN